MLDSPTIDTYLEYAAISQFLAANENASEKVFNMESNAGTQRIPFLLNLLYDSVNWAKDYYVDSEHLDATANFMYSLCGKYISRAKQLMGNPAGVITYNPTTGMVSLAFPKIQFTVGSGALMEEGNTELIITADGIKEGSFVITADGVEVPMLLGDRFSYEETPILTTPKGTKIKFNQGVTAPQVFIIKYEKITSI